MITLKIKYNTESSNLDIIQEYRKQYSSVLHCAYNLRFKEVSEKDTVHQLKTLNNISLIGSYLKRCAVKRTTQLLENKPDKPMIFGGKKTFLQRCQGKITKEEFKQKRLSKLYIIGEANQYANRFIQINSDLCSFTFKPNRNTNIQLTINGRYKRYKSILQQLYILQQDKQIPITYQLDDKYIYITYDESVIYKTHYNPIENRVFAIDLNPNYVGWSVVDWKSSSEFTIISSGVISTKDINDFDNNLKGLPSTDKKRLYINNKRKYEVFEINKYLVQIATHYRCELFITEDLSIESSDKTLGKRFNKLVNNQWNRSKMVENLKKRCNIVGIRFLTVQANYSSFIGNFLFRDLELPDMVLASIELGRRGYEFSLQYINKVKDKVKNIIFPLISDFSDRYAKSLEEFEISGEVTGLKDIYYKLKNSKSRYRVSLDDLKHLKFSRCFSNKSKVKKILITIYKNMSLIQLKIENNNIVLPKTKLILSSSLESILPKDIKILTNELWCINPDNPAEIKASFNIQDSNMEENILDVTATIKPTDIPKIFQLVGFKLQSSYSIIQEMNKEKELFEVSPLNAHFIMNQFELTEVMEDLTLSSDQEKMNLVTELTNTNPLYDEFKNMGVSSKSLYKDWQDMGISDLNFFELLDDNTNGKDLMYQIDIEEPRTIEMFYSDIKDHITNALIQIVKKHKRKNDTNLQYYVEDFNTLNFYFMPENYNRITEKYDGCQSILQKRDITLFYNEKYNDVFFAESKLDYKTASYTEVSTSEKLRLTINEELALLRYFIYKYNIE